MERALREYVLAAQAKINYTDPNDHPLIMLIASRGYLTSSEMKISWKIDPTNSSSSVEGPDLMVCVVEYLRRRDWNEEQKMVLIAPPRPSASADLDDEIPF